MLEIYLIYANILKIQILLMRLNYTPERKVAADMKEEKKE